MVRFDNIKTCKPLYLLFCKQHNKRHKPHIYNMNPPATSLFAALELSRQVSLQAEQTLERLRCLEADCHADHYGPEYGKISPSRWIDCSTPEYKEYTGATPLVATHPLKRKAPETVTIDLTVTLNDESDNESQDEEEEDVKEKRVKMEKWDRRINDLDKLIRMAKSFMKDIIWAERTDNASELRISRGLAQQAFGLSPSIENLSTRIDHLTHLREFYENKALKVNNNLLKRGYYWTSTEKKIKV